MQPSQEPRVQAYVLLVRSAEALHAEVSRGLVVEGFTPSQFSAIKALRIHGRLAQRDIARHLLKSGGSVTALVDQLELAGLVDRERDTEDRRVIYVSLTSDGVAVFDRIYPDHLERIREAMGALSDEECACFSSLAGKVVPDSGLVRCQPALSENFSGES